MKLARWAVLAQSARLLRKTQDAQQKKQAEQLWGCVPCKRMQAGTPIAWGPLQSGLAVAQEASVRECSSVAS